MKLKSMVRSNDWRWNLCKFLKHDLALDITNEGLNQSKQKPDFENNNEETFCEIIKSLIKKNNDQFKPQHI